MGWSLIGGGVTPKQGILDDEDAVVACVRVLMLLASVLLPTAIVAQVAAAGDVSDSAVAGNQMSVLRRGGMEAGVCVHVMCACTRVRAQASARKREAKESARLTLSLPDWRAAKTPGKSLNSAFSPTNAGLSVCYWD